TRWPRDWSSDVCSSDLDRSYTLVDQGGKPVSAYPYLVFSMEASTQRDDFDRIPELQVAHKALNDAIRTGREEKVKDALTVFRRRSEERRVGKEGRTGEG